MSRRNSFVGNYMGAFLNSTRSGYLACTMVVFIWAFWLVVSRLGATSNLTVYDLAAMRYGISALVALPFVVYFRGWKTLRLSRGVILTILLGPLYILTVFLGFVYAPAAHGGVFMNGPVPIMTLFLGAFLLKKAIESDAREVAVMGVTVHTSIGGLVVN